MSIKPVFERYKKQEVFNYISSVRFSALLKVHFALCIALLKVQ
ncbi:hypothetical protein FM107_14665 [Sphingobacterium sp. JB170]|nr:hypothetical protein FM107_14665 [Sphingobacterium sp. JB170]